MPLKLSAETKAAASEQSASATVPIRQLLAQNRWLMLTSGLFALLVAPSFMSYAPYRFSWDDSDYLARCILVSRALWTRNVRGLSAMVSYHPPAITWMGIPWGPIQTWDSAANCFITLAVVIALLATTAFYMLLRIGVRPAFFTGAALCIFASLGPFPANSLPHFEATAFMADCLLGWSSLAAILLIPFEARSRSASVPASLMRGIFWGLVLSLGVMTKLNFLFFVGFIVPIVLLVKLRLEGLRRALAAFIAMAFTAMPSAFYLERFGKIAFDNSKAASFGWMSHLYYVPLSQFLAKIVHQAPGLLTIPLVVAAALVYVIVSRLYVSSWDICVALAVMIAFTAIVLSSPSKDVRYLFPSIISLPFLAAILFSNDGEPLPRRLAATAAAVALLVMIAASVPAKSRAGRESLDRCDAILALATRQNARQIVLATDSPTLNPMLMELDRALSGPGFPSIGAVGWSAASGVPIEQDFQTMSRADMVVFQDQSAQNLGFTNPRVPKYERYVDGVAAPPIRLSPDLTAYFMHK